MKKFFLTLLTLILCLTVFAAQAETIELETTMLENGLTFPTPANWTEVELGASDYEEGFILLLTEEETDRCMMVSTSKQSEDISNADLLEVYAGDEDYVGAVLNENAHDHQMVLYALADETMIGYCFMDTEGCMYSILFFNANDEKISDDNALLQMVDACMADTYFDEDAFWLEDEASYETETVMGDSGVALEMVGIEDGPVFPIPAEWTEVELSNADKKDGCVAAYTDEDSGRNMLIMAAEVGEISTEKLAEMLTDDPDYAAVRLMTNDHGQDLVLIVTADLTSGGYFLMDDDGWMYSFLFSLDGESSMTDDDMLALLVQDCMANTYFEN